MKERLLKRFTAWESSETTSIVDPDVNEIMLSIQDDLEKLLNTRLGTVLIDESYGLPDFSDLFNVYAAPDVESIRLSLISLIKNYEPRLNSVNIVHNDANKSSSSLMFTLSSHFEYKNQKLPFSINANLHDDGSIVLGR